MPNRPLFCYITDRTQFPRDQRSRRARLLTKIAEAAQAGIDYIQLREKDLPAKELETLAREAMDILRDHALKTQNRELRTALLINSRTDVALAVGAEGVHLRAHDISPEDVRICSAAAPVTISVSCHEPRQVQQAAIAHADLALFAPVFEKKNASNSVPTGLAALRQACQYPIPVLALGGITLENARDCLAVGAAGIAAIRLFQENDIAEVVSRLRVL